MWLGSFFVCFFWHISSLFTLFLIPRCSRALFLHVRFHYLCYLSPWPRPGLTAGLRCPAPWALKRLITWAWRHYLRVVGGNVTLSCFCCFGSTSDTPHPPHQNLLRLPFSVLPCDSIPVFLLNSAASSVLGEAGPQVLHHAVFTFRLQTDTNDANLGKRERQRFTDSCCYLSPFLSLKRLQSAHRYKKIVKSPNNCIWR